MTPPIPAAESHRTAAQSVTATAHGDDTATIGPPEPRVLPPQPGDHIDRYRLDEQLGTGVSCYVFRGWDELKSCPVAVKIINWGNVHDRDAALKQMRTEAAALARVKHPRVLKFIDFGFDPRWPYLVTEYVRGRPLGELIRCGGALPANWTMHLLSQIVDGLGAVWRAGIVHRDLKPDNVLINVEGTAKLIDFGVAKSEILKSLETDPTRDLAGTAAYIAPEQARNPWAVDCRADIYSLGVTLYETLTGRLPFSAKNRMQMIYEHLNSTPTPPRTIEPSVPPLANDLCLWMLMKNPDERPQNYDELRQSFNTVIDSLA